MEQLDLIARSVRAGRLEVVADAAHLANDEQPEKVTALILEHVAATKGVAP